MLFKRLFTRHLEDGETLLVVVHRHWLFALRAVLWPIIAQVICVVFLVAAQHWVIQIVFGVLLVVAIEWGIRRFFDYYLDSWIVTDTSIIDTEWKGWFSRSSSRVLYSDIQGVSLEVSGLWPTVLRYGKLSVEKVSTGTSVSLPHVPRAKKVESLILRSMEAYLQKKNLQNTEHVQEILAAIVANKVQLDTLAPAATQATATSVPPPPESPKPRSGFSTQALRTPRP